MSSAQSINAELLMAWEVKWFREARRTETERKLLRAYESLVQQLGDLLELPDIWRRQAAQYPATPEGNSGAAGVRACANELERALSARRPGVANPNGFGRPGHAVYVAPPPSLPEEPCSEVRAVSFEEAWTQKQAEGYQYGSDALEQVRFGWEIAIAAGVVTVAEPCALEQAVKVAIDQLELHTKEGASPSECVDAALATLRAAKG